MTVLRLARLTRAQVHELAPTAIAVLPTGSTEQHGDHLPLGTDALLVDAVLDQALADWPSAPDRATILRLPTLPYGYSGHHLFAAALSIRPAHYLAVLADLLDSCTTTGLTRVLVVNGHGGNTEMVNQAVKDHSLHADGTYGCANYWDLLPTGDASDAGGNDPDEPDGPHPGHAGAFETSMMQAVHPELVRAAGTPVTDPPPLFDRSPYPGLTVARHGEWSRVGGVTDDAAHASPETGERRLSRHAAGLRAALLAFDDATRPAPHESTDSTDSTHSTTPHRGGRST